MTISSTPVTMLAVAGVEKRMDTLPRAVGSVR
jgi:hypothetical protein